jgi:hypothetical protein
MSGNIRPKGGYPDGDITQEAGEGENKPATKDEKGITKTPIRPNTTIKKPPGEQ